MYDFFVFYTEGNVVCFIVFTIMLVHDLLHADRQEKQIKYDHALVAFMLYFVFDSCWAAMEYGPLPKLLETQAVIDFALYLAMAAITYCWLNYVLAVERVPNRNRRVNKFAVFFPFALSTLALVVTFIVSPGTLIAENYDTQPAFSAFLVVVPYIYIAAVMIYTMRAALREENPIEKRRHIYIGFFPLMVVVGGLVQMLFVPNLPVFCFCCAILMLVFYLQSMESQISMDPLTGLNNRGQLFRYVSQASNARREGCKTYVIMLDVNDFKMINDTFGHAEGDRALIVLSHALKKVVRSRNMSIFLGRYGGDEFILIAHVPNDAELESLVADIYERVERQCEKDDLPYLISVGVGYDELEGEDDSFQKCMQRADHNLYLDKKRIKESGRTTSRR